MTAFAWSAWLASSARRVSAVSSGDVAVGHDHGARQSREAAQSAVHGVAGAALLVLDDGGRRGATSARWALTWSRPWPTTTTRWSGSSCLGGGHGVVDQGAAADGVQDLRDRRLHPGALAGGEDDHGGRSVGAHARSAPGRGGGHDVVQSAGYLPFTAGTRRATTNAFGVLPGGDSNLDWRPKRWSPALGRPGNDGGESRAKASRACRWLRGRRLRCGNHGPSSD